MSRRGIRGMTIVELMIVVVIIGILAAISVVSYRKYIGRARISEATAMLAEFSTKEQAHFLDAGEFMEAHRDTSLAQSANEDSFQFFPSDPGAYFDSVRAPVALNPLPQSWRFLGIRPRWQQLYCTYLANAGAAGAGPDASWAIGSKLWASAPNVPWFYVLAACNLNGQAGWPAFVTILSLTHDSAALRTQDEAN
jgi:prepilin-type N-terminal cleavage/methylation domain-containing protein